MNTLMFNKEAIKKVESVGHALNHPLRQKIVSLIYHEGRACPADMIQTFSVGRVEISRQLSVLKRAELIFPEREGIFIYYSLNEKLIESIHSVFGVFEE